MIINKIKTDKFTCEKPNLTIITFDEIFKSVSIHVINLVFSIYNNLDMIQTLNTDIKKIFKHSLLDQIYQRSMQETDYNCILYINTNFVSNYSEIWSYIDVWRLEPFIIKTCKEITHNAPLPICVIPGPADLLHDCGETCEVVNMIDMSLAQFRKHVTSLDKLKKYSKNNGLLQFMHKYHPEDDLKKSMFYNKYLKGANNE